MPQIARTQKDEARRSGWWWWWSRRVSRRRDASLFIAVSQTTAGSAWTTVESKERWRHKCHKRGEGDHHESAARCVGSPMGGVRASNSDRTGADDASRERPKATGRANGREEVLEEKLESHFDNARARMEGIGVTQRREKGHRGDHFIDGGEEKRAGVAPGRCFGHEQGEI